MDLIEDDTPVVVRIKKNAIIHEDWEGIVVPGRFHKGVLASSGSVFLQNNEGNYFAYFTPSEFEVIHTCAKPVPKAVTHG